MFADVEEDASPGSVLSSAGSVGGGGETARVVGLLVAMLLISVVALAQTIRKNMRTRATR